MLSVLVFSVLVLSVLVFSVLVFSVLMCVGVCSAKQRPAASGLVARHKDIQVRKQC